VPDRTRLCGGRRPGSIPGEDADPSTLLRKRRPASKGRPGQERAARRRERREVRSYEAQYAGALWHLDFHHGSLKVLTPRGQWQRPLALGILDDHSRLCCHLQWYLSETAEDLVHGLSQAIQKRGLPRALLTDNGSAMIAEEVTEGLLRLGIVHELTLPYSPYQNGKQECFWATLEGRLMAMLGGVKQLTLQLLNQATQAWAEMEYNRARHGNCRVRRWNASPAPPTCSAPVLPAKPCGRPFGCRSAGASGKATARSRWRACGSRSRPVTATSAT
jgi:putative transposase